MYKSIESEQLEFVRNTLLINHFCKIILLCNENDCFAIPLKGISLLLRTYKDYSRNVGDIDLFVAEKDIENFSKLLSTIGYIPRTPEKNSVRLKSKGKFDMIHRDKNYCDLDIHIDLINKKWFKLSTGDFTSFVLNRISIIEHNNLKINILSNIDEWLYLAQHYCFHMFSDNKWLKDLYLIQRNFSDADIAELTTIAQNFHFERVVTAVSRRLKIAFPQEDIKTPDMLSGKHVIFDSISVANPKITNKFKNRIIAIYWEFIFIHNRKSRIKSYMHLLFPQLYIIMDIYNIKYLTIAILIYPLHIILLFLSSVFCISLGLHYFFQNKRR